MNTKTHSKQFTSETELNTPKARAERLKRLRNLANLNRKELCESSDINVNTYKGWELARFGGLTIDGAQKIVNSIARAGIICTVEWLLYGEHPSPSFGPDLFGLHGEEKKPRRISPVEQEFLAYQDQFKYAILEKVSDDSLLPNIKKGDFVAGEKQYGEAIDSIIDRLCIIQTLDGKKLIRYLKRGSSKGVYSLICANPFSNSRDLVILDIKLLYAAPISRHYIIDPTFRT